MGSPRKLASTSSGRWPLVSTMGMPQEVAMRAAAILVAMPPVPRSLPAPPASDSIAGVMASTRSMRRASGFWRGSAS